jgi:hypothetical protein
MRFFSSRLFQWTPFLISPLLKWDAPLLGKLFSANLPTPTYKIFKSLLFTALTSPAVFTDWPVAFK